MVDKKQLNGTTAGMRQAGLSLREKELDLRALCEKAEADRHLVVAMSVNGPDAYYIPREIVKMLDKRLIALAHFSFKVIDPQEALKVFENEVKKVQKNLEGFKAYAREFLEAQAQPTVPADVPPPPETPNG